MEKELDVCTTAHSAIPQLGRGFDAVALEHCAKRRDIAEVS
jgi:hypothetical protein